MREHASCVDGERRMQRTALGAAADPLRGATALLVALAFSLALCACSTTRLQPPPSEAPPAGPYQFGEGDMLAVRVWKNEELSVQVPVRPDGMISVPLLDDVKAAGMTADQLKEEIAKKLGEFISNPNVTVILLESAKRVYVQGEVQRPGPVSLATQLSVVDAITASGGFTPFADEGDIRVIRRNPEGQELEFGFNYKAYVRGRAPGTNIVLQPGDLVVVP
jgi:polysaccharide export outer membrane protein